MSDTLACPLCGMENIYPDGANHVCADCGHEWPAAGETGSHDADAIVRDVNGNLLTKWRHSHRDQGPEGERFVDPVEAGQRDSKHPPGRWR
jgi:hypothetical protein